MDLSPDPVLDRINRTVQTRLAALGVGQDGTGAGELAALRDIDALAYEAPVGAGGFDLGLACGVVVCTELGRRALRDVYTDSLLVVDALAAGDDHGATAASVTAGELPVVAGGLDVVSVGGRERLAARRVAGGWELSGTVVVDDAGFSAAACCVPLVADDEVVLALLSPDRWRPRTTGSVARFSTLVMDGLIVGDADILGRLGAGSPLSDPAGLLARTRLRHAAYLLGLGEGGHELAVRYASVRRQFGRPILDNQAVAFPLAQNEIALCAARLSLQHAIWLADAGAAFALEAAEALALAAETTLRSIRTAVQVHGARGMSLESPIHAFYQVVRSAVTRLGSASPLWREAGARRLAAANAARPQAVMTSAVHP